MATVTISISEELSEQLKPYRDNLDALLRLGLRELKLAEGLALY